jgi:hypothetical protein
MYGSLICRASCKDDDTLPWLNVQWVTGYRISKKNTSAIVDCRFAGSILG